MCGICGVAGEVGTSLLTSMTQAMLHRGPDDDGYHIDQGIGLGVRRLSIIDVTGGHQPLMNEDGSLVVAFNGEIYNHRELRARLDDQGHRFATRSDTEVLLHLHEEYGDAAVHLLQGMFAYALWSQKHRRLVLVRDRLGIKPLYYVETGKCLLFASEVKALLQHPDVEADVDLKALELYLAFRYVPGPETLFKGIKRLQPGHFLVHESGRTVIHRYWEPVLGDFLPGTRLDEAVEEFGDLLQKTVRSELISDVPVGMLLSGGIDSSAIAAVMARASDRPITTFTVGFDLPGAHNELDQARAVANHLGADHHELVLSPNAAELLPNLVYHLDEPVADPALLPTYLICRFAREKVPVVLTGEGGDELLGGYPRYQWFARASRLKRRLPAWFRERVLLAIGRIAPLSARYHTALDNLLAERDDVTRHLNWVAGLDPALRSELLSPEMGSKLSTSAANVLLEPYLGASATSAELVHRLMALDMRTWLVDDVLTKMDKMSMAASVEARVPFLDHRLVEFVAGVPLAVKLAQGPKTLLRRAARPLLPDATVRRRKHAFQIPLEPWLAGPLAGFVREILLDGRAQRRGWFETRRVQALLTANGNGRKVDGQSVWTLLCLELWAREFLDGNRRYRGIPGDPSRSPQPARIK